MNINALNSATVNLKNPGSAEQVDRERKQNDETAIEQSPIASEKSIQPEELLSQIKALTEDGLYSVRFENNEAQRLIVKIVDSKTDEVIRQIPPEELTELTKHLDDLQGNLVDTMS